MSLHTVVVVGVTLGAYFLFAAAVDAMLPPLPGKERTTYGYLYRVLQGLAANASRLAEARFHLHYVPQAQLQPQLADAGAQPQPADPAGLPLGHLAASAVDVAIDAAGDITLTPQP